MASPTKISWNRRTHRDKKFLKKRQARLRKVQIAQAEKLSKLLGA